MCRRRSSPASRSPAIDVFSAGALAAADDGDDEITLHDAKRGLYKKLILRDDRVGRLRVLYGSVTDGPWYVELMRDKADVSAVPRPAAVRPRLCRAASASVPQPRLRYAGSLMTPKRTRGRNGRRRESAPPAPIAASAAGCASPPTARCLGRPGPSRQRGRLCSKGAALGDTLATDGRLLYPQIGGRNCKLGRSARSRRGRHSRAPSPSTGRMQSRSMSPASS